MTEEWLYLVEHQGDPDMYVLAVSLPEAAAKISRHYIDEGRGLDSWRDGRGFSFTALAPVNELDEGVLC